MSKFLIIFFLSLLLAGFPIFVFATAGTIVAGKTYAWSTNGGWVNFGCTNCNVQLENGSITGNAWNQNFGWINLNPATSGVKYNSAGELSGQAWGQNTGWIDFSNAEINSQGQFTGTATGTIIGTVNFDCNSLDTGCPVTTTWRPTSLDPTCGDSVCNGSETCSTCSTDCGNCGGGGGGIILPITPATPKPTICKANDINCDGNIDAYDLAVIMAQWTETGASLLGDLNSDGFVNEYDLAVLMANWGS